MISVVGSNTTPENAIKPIHAIHYGGGGVRGGSLITAAIDSLVTAQQSVASEHMH